MKITCSFDNLFTVLNNVSIVVGDSMSSEEMKNIIIRVYKETGVVELIGVNQIITYRVELANGEYSIEVADEEYKDSGIAECQIKSKEIIAFLSTFKTVRRTKVTDVVLETVKNKISVTVSEEDLESSKIYKSHWVLDNIPIKANMLPSINLTMPEETEPFDVAAATLYTSSLLPIMQNSMTLYSKLAFGENVVVAFDAAFTTLMKNFISGVFKDFCLSYRALSFIKSIICNETGVEVAKTNERVCFKTDNSVAFIRYETKMPQYAIYEKMIDKSHAIELDRQYLKDVLKRLSLVNESITVNISTETNTVEVKNSKFNQELPIIQSKAMAELGEVTFKILPEVLNKAIIGEDAAFSPTVFIYLVPQEKGGYTIIFSDDSGSWHSIARMR